MKAQVGIILNLMPLLCFAGTDKNADVILNLVSAPSLSIGLNTNADKGFVIYDRSPVPDHRLDLPGKGYKEMRDNEDPRFSTTVYEMSR